MFSSLLILKFLDCVCEVVRHCVAFPPCSTVEGDGTGVVVNEQYKPEMHLHRVPLCLDWNIKSKS